MTENVTKYSISDVRMKPGVVQYLSRLGPGIQTATTCSYLIDEVCAKKEEEEGDFDDDFGEDEVESDEDESDEDDEYKDLSFMRNNLVVRGANLAGEQRYWFCESKYNKELKRRPKEVGLFLLRLGDYDHELGEIHENACIEEDELSISVRRVYDSVETKEIQTFRELLYEPREKRVSRRWRLVRAATRLLASHAEAAKTANHPDRKRSRGEFEINDE